VLELADSMVEGHVPKGVEVQVLSSRTIDRENPRFAGDFYLYVSLQAGR